MQSNGLFTCRVYILRCVALLLLCAVLAVVPVSLAAAETSGIPPYVRVTDKNVYFYTSPSTATPLFAVVPTYYLKVVGAQGEFWQVELALEGDYHAKLCGYVLAAKTVSVFDAPQLPLYPSVTAQVTSSAARLMLTPSDAARSVITAAYGQTCGYYGKLITADKEWYYVSFYGNLGYVDASTLSTPVISPHPTPIETTNPVTVVDEPHTPDKIQDDDTTAPYFDGVQLALILLITIPTLVIIVVMITPEKRRRSAPITVNYDSLTDVADKPTASPKPRYYDDNL